MSIEEMAIIGLIIVSIGVQYLVAKASARIMKENIMMLDQNIAQALERIVEELPFDQLQPGEPMNPFQQIIAQKIAESMNPTVQVTEIQRADDGKFT